MADRLEATLEAALARAGITPPPPRPPQPPATLADAIRRYAARQAMRALFAQTEIPAAETLGPGPTPRMKAMQSQQNREEATDRPWPRRRFETIRAEELWRFNRLLDVSPEAACAWRAANRVMLVVEIRVNGTCWTSRATLWEAPTEAAFMAADDGKPAPDDATHLAMGWRRVGGCRADLQAEE